MKGIFDIFCKINFFFNLPFTKSTVCDVVKKGRNPTKRPKKIFLESTIGSSDVIQSG